MNIELGSHLNQIPEIARESYAQVYSFGSLKCFSSQQAARSFLETELSRVSDVSDRNERLVIDRGIYKGLPTLLVRLYASGQGVTLADREIDSFKQGFMVFKVKEGSSIVYEVNYAT